MDAQLQSLLVDRSMDLHALFQPSAFGLKDGLDTAFSLPHQKVKLYPQTTGEVMTGSTDEGAVGAITIEDGWFDLSSLRFTQTMRVTNAADANQPADYATGTASTHIAFQNGATLWANMKDATIKIRNNVLTSYAHPWMEDIQQKYLMNTDAVSTFGKIEGFSKDVGAADSRLVANTGYGARAGLIRPGTAGAAATAFTTISYMDAIPLFREKRLVYLTKGGGITIEFTLRACDNRDLIERDNTAVAARRYLDKFHGEIDRYYPDNPIAESLKALYLSTPQKFVYQDYRVDMYPIPSTTIFSQQVNTSNNKIKALIVGFQSTTAVNKRQFIPSNVSNIYVQRGERQIPANGGYHLPADNNKVYFDYITSMKETANGAGTILDPTTHSTIFKLYYFDLKHGPSGIPESADELNKSDSATIFVEFSTATAANMYVMVVTDTKFELSLDPNTPLKTPQTTK